MALYISAPFPDLDLADSSTLTVDTLDASAVIVSLAVHFRQDTPSELLDAVGLPPLFSYVPTTGA